MASSISAASLAAQLERLSLGLTELHEGIVAIHDDVRALIEIMRRSERTADELLNDLRAATVWLLQVNDRSAHDLAAGP